MMVQFALEEVARLLREGRTGYLKLEMKLADDAEIARIVMVKPSWE